MQNTSSFVVFYYSTNLHRLHFPTCCGFTHISSRVTPTLPSSKRIGQSTPDHLTHRYCSERLQNGSPLLLRLFKNIAAQDRSGTERVQRADGRSHRRWPREGASLLRPRFRLQSRRLQSGPGGFGITNRKHVPFLRLTIRGRVVVPTNGFRLTRSVSTTSHGYWTPPMVLVLHALFRRPFTGTAVLTT